MQNPKRRTQYALLKEVHRNLLDVSKRAVEGMKLTDNKFALFSEQSVRDMQQAIHRSEGVLANLS